VFPRRILLIILIAIAIAVPGASMLGNASVAYAQTWEPKGKKKKRKKKKPARKKKRKTKKKKKAKPHPDEELIDEDRPGDDEPFDAEIIEEDVEDEDIVLDEEDRFDGENNPSDEDVIDEDDFDDDGFDDDADDGATMRFDDELDDVGADVTFSEGDLTTDATTSGDGITRLETLAMTYLRMGIDTVHDGVPTTPDGIDAVGEDIFAFRAHGRAEGTTRFGKRIKIKVAGRFNADLSLDSNTNIGVQRYEADVWDTYADAYFDWIDFRFGKQIVAWGAADLLTVNDVVNARDLRRGLAEEPDELRLPVVALSATAYEGPLSVQALYVPVAPVNRFELIEGDYALLGPNAPTPIERRVGAIVSALADDPTLAPTIGPITEIGESPNNGIETGEVGGSAALRTESVDLFGYFLWGHERTPSIAIAPALGQVFVNTAPDMLTPELIGQTITDIAAMGEAAVGVEYPRRIHGGGAIAAVVGPTNMKLDVGYSPQASAILVPERGIGPLLGEVKRLPQLGATLSLDYDRGTELNIVLEASYARVLDVPSDRIVYQMDGDELYMTAGLIDWNPRNGALSFRVLGFFDVTQQSYAIKPALRLSGHDNLSVEIGAGLYGGPAGTFGGVADRNDEVIVTFQYGL
jgi:hypothetical protein